MEESDNLNPNESKSHFEKMNDEQKKDLGGFIDSLDKMNHEMAMKTVSASSEPMIPNYYLFLHYSVQLSGHGRNTSDSKVALDILNEKHPDDMINIEAIFEKDSNCMPIENAKYRIKRSILYINPQLEVQFLEGKKVDGKIDSATLTKVINSYKK